MQHDHGVSEPNCVNNPVSSLFVPNPNFFNAFANCRHWLKVIRLLTSLNLIDLVARILPRIFREVS